MKNTLNGVEKAEKVKVAIFVKGGIVQIVLANTKNIDIEVVDADSDITAANKRWNKIAMKLRHLVVNY